MLIKIHPENPPERHIDTVVECLKKGGVIIYPTDTVYGLGCDITNQKAIERVCRIKGVRPEKAQLSFICQDLRHLADYCKPIDNSTFRILKKVLPGPFTFILNANNQVPKLLNNKKKTVGIRVPDNKIARCIVEGLGNPVISTSIRDDDEIIEYSTDPELIYEKYASLVDMVIDGGYGGNEASTVIDFTSGEVEVLRRGKGDPSVFL
ncbi:tRNA threonylcarbamoyl adenosine modification protein (Sua5/YciO/YrdC/YwlC family) [Anseongella ginsenosidimutans]|uniref:tRNA threonylcarbamoyl adenosine modification protein (Sua5/YciO/YrdC/YwlC family) n=1 Tax=Anseongella ginsenosidimutans TaxID=496056 RepID=A0A4V2UTV4_9SPHI|nr:L-threonylcarbamoyladenylate synthase [Anseongella ginsenosidimutans]QEC53215.1 threonylcarbamoyl-AMP synthase [Anseongella ginsenosidimutans]TCS87848.1 tRNA threonylcarbamoyl adenosine modification protein (Sua5/YciO/YrdC/YwlC family) [Anseongella ginsenosidimutans]